MEKCVESFRRPPLPAQQHTIYLPDQSGSLSDCSLEHTSTSHTLLDDCNDSGYFDTGSFRKLQDQSDSDDDDSGLSSDEAYFEELQDDQTKTFQSDSLNESPNDTTLAIAPHHLELPRKLLGTGGFSEVWLVNPPEKKRIALKVFTKKFQSLTEKQLIAIAKTEYDVISKFNHPHVVAAFGLTANECVIAISQEFMEEGDLFTRITPNVGLPAAEGATVLAHVCSGLHYLHHERGIAHLDLKCENVLLGRTDEGQLVAKLADFDAALPLGARKAVVRGTADAHPPEYLVASPSGYVIDSSADVWAVGLIAYVLLFGRYAWDLPSPTDKRYLAYRMAPSSAFPDSTPEFLQSLFEQIFEVEASKRPSAKQLGEHIASSWLRWVEVTRTPPAVDGYKKKRVHGSHVGAKNWFRSFFQMK